MYTTVTKLSPTSAAIALVSRALVAATLAVLAQVAWAQTREAGRESLKQPAVSEAGQRSKEQDRQALIALENEWLNAHDAPTLDRILASDFVHPVVTGDFLTKSQHIDWVTRHPPPANIKWRFDRLDIRVYGDVGIANGTVVGTDEHGQETGRGVFTDVFAYRDGRWQAVNAQENPVTKMNSVTKTK